MALLGDTNLLEKLHHVPLLPMSLLSRFAVGSHSDGGQVQPTTRWLDQVPSSQRISLASDGRLGI